MPIHFYDLDVISEVEGLRSALIVPCNMCPAVTVAAREKKPFLQFLTRFLTSAPFANYIQALQSRLGEKGVKTKVFKNRIPHQWFMCMWTRRRCKKLQRYARKYEAVIVLGCESATKTVRDSIQSSDCKVIEGMETAGIMNAKLRLQFPCDVSFEDCKIVPISQRKKVKDNNRAEINP